MSTFPQNDLIFLAQLRTSILNRSEGRAIKVKVCGEVQRVGVTWEEGERRGGMKKKGEGGGRRMREREEGGEGEGEKGREKSGRDEGGEEVGGRRRREREEGGRTSHVCSIR